MTNRDYLNAMSTDELGNWLKAEKVEPVVKSSTDWTMFPNFKPYEFVCDCKRPDCEFSTPESVMDMDPKLLWILQAVRNKFGKAVKITCGVRCKAYNDSLSNAVENSPHMYKKGTDFYIAGQTSTESGRDEVVTYMKKLPGYSYAYHNKGGKYPKMGSAVHVNV